MTRPDGDSLKTVIVFDSVFGNTAKIAQAIGTCVNEGDNAEKIHIGEVTSEKLQGVGLLIVGSPTRQFRPTEAITNFLKTLSKNQLAGINVAAFDTRIDLETIESGALRFIVDKGGYAARYIAKELTARGGKLVAPAVGFLVTGEEGPLKDGELERAADWAKHIQEIVS